MFQFLCFVLGVFSVAGFEYALPYQTQTFRSPPIPLRPGEVVNTDARTYLLSPAWPKGPIALRYFGAEVVDETDTPVPLTELYIHHWVIYVDMGKYNWGPCANLPSTWGIGAEMRGTVYRYPDPYAIVMTGNETISANLHFIRTVDVADTQLCIECNCNGSTPQQPIGHIGCCPDKSICWSAQNPNGPAKTYYLKYTIGWTAVDSSVHPLTAYTMDVTMDESDKHCHIEYQVSQSSVAEGQLNIWQNVSYLSSDVDVVFMEVHQHVGGLMYSVEHLRNGVKIGDMCNVRPTYGNGTAVGNSKNYVVAIPTCEFDPPYQLKAGDELRLTSVYDERHIPGGHAYHEGVMGLALFYGERKSATPCEVELKTACGNPLPADSQVCLQCAAKAYQSGALASCIKNSASWDKGGHQIRFFCTTDNGIKRPYPIN